MHIDDEIRDELKKYLDDTDVSEFENGEICLLLDEPKYALLRVTDDGLMRADIEKETSIEKNYDITTHYKYSDTSPSDALERIKKQQKITVAPLEIWFRN